MIYEGAWPDSITHPGVKKLLEDYLRLSNASNPKNPHDKSEEAFAALFADDGVYQLASKKAQSPAEITKMRHALFAHIPHREHKAIKFFTFGSNQFEIMCEGEVDYEHHHGHKTASSWAGRLSIKEEGGQTKFKLLQIVVDTAAHT
ncbi:MAG: hypothetical protein M1828_000866 [Chrysothrix sp. TS-e1954]|nr:MAG: hypothetical protein M1828_000866 [Chrysothrix sp. TS-e1954]